MCHQAYSDDRPATPTFVGWVRTSPKHKWKATSTLVTCLPCARRGAELGRPEVAATSEVAWAQTHLNDEDAVRGDCECCGIPVALPRNARRKRLYCSTACRVKLAKGTKIVPVSATGKACDICGEQFTPKRSDAVYCSNACRQKAARKRNSADLRGVTMEERRAMTGGASRRTSDEAMHAWTSGVTVGLDMIDGAHVSPDELAEMLAAVQVIRQQARRIQQEHRGVAEACSSAY